MSLARFFVAGTLLACLAACGGDVGSGTVGGSSSPAPVTSAAAGLYVGYFQEDAVSDPTDPRPGPLVLNVPAAGGVTSGSMSFADPPCPPTATVAVTGSRTDLGVSANWSGTVDGAQVAGTLSGTLDTTSLAYKGTYLVTGGKQPRSVVGTCDAYTIAANGTLELFPVERNFPVSFTVTVTGRTVSWVPITGVVTGLVYVIDPAVAQASGDPILWQGRVGLALAADIPTTVTLQTGRPYVAVVALADTTHGRVAFASQRFTAP